MKLKTQIGALLVLGAIISIVIIAFPFSDPLSKSREELNKLYKTEFNDAVITSISEHRYEGGKGVYSKFKTNTSNQLYPILLAKSSPGNQSRFVNGAVLNKRSNSFEILIKDKDNQTHITLVQNYEKERLWPWLLLFFLAFFGVVYAFKLYLRKK